MKPILVRPQHPSGLERDSRKGCFGVGIGTQSTGVQGNPPGKVTWLPRKGQVRLEGGETKKAGNTVFRGREGMLTSRIPAPGTGLEIVCRKSDKKAGEHVFPYPPQ
jgi:hypothetical protein